MTIERATFLLDWQSQEWPPPQGRGQAALYRKNGGGRRLYRYTAPTQNANPATPQPEESAMNPDAHAGPVAALATLLFAATAAARFLSRRR